MLTIRIVNTGDGTNESANYEYFVFVNGKEIERGDYSGHNRKDGWAALVKSIAEQHLAQRPLRRAKREAVEESGHFSPALCPHGKDLCEDCMNVE